MHNGEQPSKLARKILLVEDNPDVGFMLARVLESSGHSVTCAASAAEALQLSVRESFEIVISDVALPDGSGHELIGELRRTGPLVSIALTAYGGTEAERASLDAGFDIHLVKPVTVERLLAAIDQLCSPRTEATAP
jgi:two-component system CheB/CheR fusion protein